MYYGKMTEELKKLYIEYDKIFGVYPEFYIDMEYGQADYADYVSRSEEHTSELQSLSC